MHWANTPQSGPYRCTSPSPSALQVLGTFTSGRLEAFLPQKCLSPAQLKDSRIAAAIAVALQRFHSIPAPVRVFVCVIPGGRADDLARMWRSLH